MRVTIVSTLFVRNNLKIGHIMSIKNYARCASQRNFKREKKKRKKRKEKAFD